MNNNKDHLVGQLTTTAREEVEKPHRTPSIAGLNRFLYFKQHVSVDSLLPCVQKMGMAQLSSRQVGAGVCGWVY